MSEKDVAILEALLLELVEIINEKPALAKRLVAAIEHRFVNVPLDPIAIYSRDGFEALKNKLNRQTVDTLKLVTRQYHIPCRNLEKRKKGELVSVISEYAANTDIRRGSEIQPLHAD